MLQQVTALHLCTGKINLNGVFGGTELDFGEIVLSFIVIDIFHISLAKVNATTVNKLMLNIYLE